ncbi:SDR family NAD(P)-dependent oxidoreductase, partial [Pseudomonas aeruginosa]
MQNILITGAASGIGAASARLFHRRGWRVGLLDIDAEALCGVGTQPPGTPPPPTDINKTNTGEIKK